MVEAQLGRSFEGPPSRTVLRAIAEAEGIPPHELEPLYEAVDLEALDHLIASGLQGEVVFTYDEYQVVIDGNGSVTVVPQRKYRSRT